MRFDIITIKDFLEVIDPHLLSSMPLNLNPNFLSLSARHLQNNFHLLVNSGFGVSEITPFYGWIKNESQKTLGFIPILRVESSENLVNLIPSREFDRAIFYKHNDLDPNLIKSLKNGFVENFGRFYCQSLTTGWDLSSSLLSIFNWFPPYERKEMLKRPTSIHFQEVDYSNGASKFKKFYEFDLIKKKNFPGLIRRDVDLFQDSFPENYRLFLIEQDDHLIGATSFIDYLDKVYQMELIGNSVFNKSYPKILFLFLQHMKKENKMAIYTAFFEWCLIPFLADIVRRGNVDMSLFLKKAEQMKARNIKEIE